MKVLQINSFFSVGGPPRIVQGIYETLEANGHECVVAAGREKPYPGMKTIQIGSPINKYWHLVMSRIFDAQGLSSSLATKRLIKQVEAYDPDIIHLHNLHGYYLNIEILFNYLKTANKPVVWTLHDCWPFTGHCAHFDYIGCDKWKAGCYDCPQQMEYPTCNGFDRSEYNYHSKNKAFNGVSNLRIVTVSKWLATMIRQSYLKDYPVQVINNGINQEIFKPTASTFRSDYGLEHKTIILGVAQNWSEKKGFNDFCQLAELLDDNYHIVLVGLMPKQSNNIPPGINAISRIPDPRKLVEVFSAADVFVNLSYEETFGLVTVEALACGTPVIVYDRTAVAEVVDQRSGIVKKDLKDVYYAIINREWLGINSFDCEQQANKYSDKDRYQEYLDLYATIVEM